MRTRILKRLFLLSIAAFVGFSHRALAYSPPLPGGAGIPVPTTTAISNIGNFYYAICIATQWVLVFGLIIGVLFIIVGGIKYVTSEGDERKSGEGKKTIITAIVGVVFLLLAVVIVRVIASFFGGDLSKFKLTECPGSGSSTSVPAPGDPGSMPAPAILPPVPGSSTDPLAPPPPPSPPGP